MSCRCQVGSMSQRDGMLFDPLNADYLRRGAILIADPLKVFAFISSTICALLLLLFIWIVWPTNSQQPWPMEWVLGWALLFFAPLAIALWATIVPQQWEMPTYGLVRRLIQVHALTASLVMVGGCVLRPEIFHGILVLSAFFAFGALLIDLVILFWSPWSGFDPEDVHTYRALHLKVAGGTVAAVIVWSFANIGLVVAQAQYFSHGRPYCLEVASRGYGYRRAASLLDLNALSMRGASDRRGLDDTFHGVLVIDTALGLERRNWLYMPQHFALLEQDPSRQSYLRPSCQLRTDFALQLPLW